MRHRMKHGRSLKIALVAASLMLVPASARGQFAFGLNVGPSLTNLSGSFIESSQLTAGIYVGAIFDYQFSRHWALETGFSSVQKGAFSVEGSGVDGLWDVRTSYLQVPLRLRYLAYLGDGDWVLGPFAGVSYSFSGGCEIREVGFPAFDDECTEETAFGPHSTSDFMWAFGLVIDKMFGTSAFGFDVRYARGTSDLFTDAAAQGLGSKTTAIDIKIRLVFPHFGDSRW